MSMTRRGETSSELLAYGTALWPMQGDAATVRVCWVARGGPRVAAAEKKKSRATLTMRSSGCGG
jgi:hypothetical protein